MGCCPSTAFTFFLLWVGTGLYVGGGIAGLSGTIDLFVKYGPVKGRGNPALDDPPSTESPLTTGERDRKSPKDPGNLVPLAFNSVRHVLITWAVVIVLTSIVLIMMSKRSKDVLRNHGDLKTSGAVMCCTSWLTGFSVFLMLLWFVQAGFAVLPLLEYRIAVQRCWDLKSPEFSLTSKRAICIDLVQFGLVRYRETDDDGFALVCGPGGNFIPPRGDLEGFCEAYQVAYTLFVLCFTGAGLGIIALMLYALEHISNSAYLKAMRYHTASDTYFLGSEPTEKSPRPQSQQKTELPPHPEYSDYRIQTPHSTHQANPSYTSSVLKSCIPQAKVPDVISFRRYHPDEKEDALELHQMESNPKYRHLVSDTGSSDNEDDVSVSVSVQSHEDTDDDETKDSDSDVPDARPKKAGRLPGRETAKRAMRGPPLPDQTSRRSRSSVDALGSPKSSATGRRSRRSLKQQARRPESPGSDFYMNEDQRRKTVTHWG